MRNDLRKISFAFFLSTFVFLSSCRLSGDFLPVNKNWSVTGSASVFDGPCNLYQLTISTPGLTTVDTDTAVIISASGSGEIFQSFSDCNLDRAVTQITVPAGTNQATFYFKDYTAETVQLKAGGGTAFSIAVAHQGFVSGSGLDNFPQFLVPASDGTSDVYVSGTFTNYNGVAASRLARIHRDGTIDQTFANNIGSGLNGESRNILPLTDGSGRIYVIGAFTSFNGHAISGIVRINTDGSYDPTFNASGVGVTSVGDVQGVIFANDGTDDIYVVGFYGGYNGNSSAGINRIHSDGTIDAAFHSGTGVNSWNPAVLTVPNEPGKIYIGTGGGSVYNGTAITGHLIKLNRDGSVDTSFAPVSGCDGAVLTLNAVNDGTTDIYVGGFFTNYNGQATGNLVRVRADGSLSPQFNLGTGATNGILNVFPSVSLPGTLYFGNPTSFDSVSIGYFARANANGSLDTRFPYNPGFNNSIYALTEATDGSGDVWVGGPFTTFNGVTENRLLRLNKYGQIP